MEGHYVDDCVTHACAIAKLLLEARHSPWIARFRETIIDGDRVFHAPLTPKRIPGVTWTTHYVACSGREMYDPLAGIPTDIDVYATVVFGRSIAAAMHLDAGQTERLLISGELRQSFRSR